MNPLTLVKRIQNINSKEASLGISDEASWHAKYKDSAYVFVGGIPFDLTEGDLLAVFAQYGEVVDVNLVRDKDTRKSKGFAFLAYEDQRSTNLAVDNLNGAQILGRVIRVDHVTKYKKKEEEDEETERKKREERGVCRAFQRGECTRGASCKFSHDEQRAANTGWGAPEDASSKWGHDKFDGHKKERDLHSEAKKSRRRSDDDMELERRDRRRREDTSLRKPDNDEFEPRTRDSDRREEKRHKRQCDDDDFGSRSREDHIIREERRSRQRDYDSASRSTDDHDRKRGDRANIHDDTDRSEPKEKHDLGRREEKRSRR
ncbi:hypothetical protein K1719_024421 [Acacia pycnantha]|nr:hypothetical protein K1719_024421 [Acacia pycnantha]